MKSQIILLLITTTIFAQVPKSIYFDFDKHQLNQINVADFESINQNKNIQISAIQGFCDK